MHKKIALLLCVIMVLSAVFGIFSIASANTDYTYVRVKLSIGTPTSFSFLVDGNYSVSGTALERQLYTVRIDGSQLRLYRGSTLVASGSTIYLTRHQGTAGQNNSIWLNNTAQGYRSYIGDMSFSIQSGAIQMVNRIYIEEYLYGVVPYEMSNSFPMEALKSQAVAARNYTVSKISASGTYDLTDLSSIDQVYKGYDPSLTNAIAAVNATAGKVIKQGSTIIAAYYSASNGGATDVPVHRWGGGASWTYYDIQPDPYDLANPSSLYETIYFPVSINEANPVTTRGNDGTPNAETAKNYIRQKILDSGQLASYGVTGIAQFTLTGVTQLAAHTFDTFNEQDHSRPFWRGENNCIDMVNARGNFTVTLAPELGGTTVGVNNVEIEMRYLNGSNGTTTYKAFSSTRLGVLLVEPVYSGGTLTGFNISQRRYGHGIGLSQRGAQQRANSSDSAVNTYDKILSFYYPATTLDTLSIAAPTLPAALTVTRYDNATIVCQESLNVRSGPGTGYSILGTFPKGARTEVMTVFYTTDWHMINYGGTTAYIHKDYVTLDNVLLSSIAIRDRGKLFVRSDTSCAALKSSLVYQSGTVTVTYAGGGAVPDAARITAGMVVRLMSGSTELDKLTVHMRGDTNGDGVVNIADYVNVRMHILGLKLLSGINWQMADINGDGVLSIADYTKIRLYLLGLESL
jgi:SpoIID/LytB domain protein